MIPPECLKTLDKTLRAPSRGSRTRNSTNERSRIKDSARERHGLFRCGAFGAACVAVHRSNYSGVASPKARMVIQH
jgi:hypothetical protein